MKKIKFNKVLPIFCAFGFSFFMMLYFQIINENIPISTITGRIASAMISKRAWALFFLCLMSSFVFIKWHSKITSFLYKYRYLIATVIFILCVFFEVNGSSIGAWSTYFTTGGNNVLFGMSRLIRSDEWGVLTPMTINQTLTNSFSYFSETIRSTKTDVFLEYGLPVKNILILYRPFYIGYLFLSFAKGYSFFWCGRFIALTLVSFEFGMFITNKNKTLSFLYALMIMFAPVVQWWFAINGLVEMLIYIQLSLIMLQKFMTTTDFKKHCLYTCVILICAGGYVLTFYPSWQIPLVYILLFLILWVIVENYKHCHMGKRDWLLVVIAIVLFVGSMGYLWHMSGETIQTIMSTSYPGKRIAVGGDSMRYIGMYLSNIWSPILDDGPFGNASESANFIDLFPLGYILYAMIRIKSKKRDVFSTCLLIPLIIMSAYCFLGFPEILAKITFLSYSSSNRVWIAIGFGNVLLLIRSLSLYKEKILQNKLMIISISVFFSICLTLLNWSLAENVEFYAQPIVPVVMIVVFTVVFISVFFAYNHKGKQALCFVLGLTMIESGLLVNPIRLGFDDVTSSELVEAISSYVHEDPDATWISVDEPFPMNNIALMSGASALNCTNVYPNLEVWKKIDTDGEYEDIYNRYAHINIQLKEEGEATFELTFIDAFTVTMTVSDLETLGVSYIYTTHPQTIDGLEMLENVDGYYIYKVVTE